MPIGSLQYMKMWVSVNSPLYRTGTVIIRSNISPACTAIEWPGDSMNRKATRSLAISNGVSESSFATFAGFTRVMISTVRSVQPHSTG